MTPQQPKKKRMVNLNAISRLRSYKKNRKCFCQLGSVSKSDLSAMKMRMEGQFTDANLRTSDGKIVAVHRVFITTLSPSIKLILDRPNISVQLFVTNKILEKLIEMAYTGTCTATKEILPEMLEAGKLYDINSALKLCGDFILSDICPDNAVSYLRLTKRYLCEHYLEKVSQSLRRNFSVMLENMMELSSNEMVSLVDKDDLAIGEYELVKFLAAWGNGLDSGVLKFILEDVRFNLLSPDELKETADWPFFKQFVDGPFKVEALSHAVKMLQSNPTKIRKTLAFRKRKGHRIPREVVLVLGGWVSYPQGPTDKSESFNCIGRKWSILEGKLKLPGNRAYHGLINQNNQVYLVGGYDAVGPTYYKTLHRLDLDTAEWHQLSDMRHKRCYVSVVETPDGIVAIGGHDGRERHRSVERYRPEVNQWEMLPSMNFKRSDLAAVSYNGILYAMGGFTGEQVLNSVEMYDPTAGSWELASPLTSQRSGVSAVVLEEKIYVLGGFNGTERLKSVECFTPGPVRSIWHDVPDMITPRSNFTAAVINGKIIVIGGYTDPSVHGKCEMFCPRTNTWSPLPDLSLGRSALSHVIITWDHTDNLPYFLEKS